jgi:Cu(I)/Ag(I) efflux system membrane fusion protein
MSDRENDLTRTPAGAHGGEQSFEEGLEAPPRGVHVMAMVRWILLAVAGVLAAGSILDYAGVLDLRGAGAEEKAEYTCGMHPQIVQDHPGECPICHMTLVKKVPNAAAPGAGGPPGTPAVLPGDGGARTPRPPVGVVPVDLPPERVQLSGLRTARVAERVLGAQLSTVGYVTADERKLSRIESRYSGWVERLLVAQTGARVNRGQVVAQVFSQEVYAAQQELLNALKWNKVGTVGGSREASGDALVASARRRLELLQVDPRDIARIEQTGQPLKTWPLRSQTSGTVVRKNAFPGLYFQAGTTLFEVADLSTVWVLADLYEQDIAGVREGMEATFRPRSRPGQSVTGKVGFVYPTLETESRTLKARLVFENKDQALRPGEYGEVTIDRGEVGAPKKNVLTIPVDALIDTGEAQYVYVETTPGHFEPRAVVVGRRTLTTVEVIDGVKAGETVVTTANFLIDSESRLRASLGALVTAPGHAGHGGGTGGASGLPMSADCEQRIDRQKFPAKYLDCVQCERVHRGMGSMEDDCKKVIPRPWK